MHENIELDMNKGEPETRHVNRMGRARWLPTCGGTVSCQNNSQVNEGGSDERTSNFTRC